MANAKPAMVPAAPAYEARSKCGPSITRTPTKPTITADQRNMRTCSLRNIADRATVISGATKEMAVASTIGSRANAAKLQNMPPMLIRPRPTCPSAHRRRELVAPRVDQHHRKDGEGGAQEHDLPDRIPFAEKAHERRHHCEQQRRHHLEQDRLDDVHVSDCSPALDGRVVGVVN